MEKRIHARFAPPRKYGQLNEFFEVPRAEALAFFEQMSYESIAGTGASLPTRQKKRGRTYDVQDMQKEMAKMHKKVTRQGVMLEKLVSKFLN